MAARFHVSAPLARRPARPDASPPAPAPATTATTLEQARRDKLAKLGELGIDPWGQRFDDAAAIAAVRTEGEALDKAADDGPTVPVGRKVF